MPVVPGHFDSGLGQDEVSLPDFDDCHFDRCSNQQLLHHGIDVKLSCHSVRGWLLIGRWLQEPYRLWTLNYYKFDFIHTRSLGDCLQVLAAELYANFLKPKKHRKDKCHLCHFSDCLPTSSSCDWVRRVSERQRLYLTVDFACLPVVHKSGVQHFCLFCAWWLVRPCLQVD